MECKNIYVIGENASKSLSPHIFNYWFLKYSINAEYKYKEIPKKNFNSSIKKILIEKNLIGLNITIPYKEKILIYLNDIENHAKIIGAINCVTVKEKKFFGSNTDWIGYKKSLEEKTQYKDRYNKEAIIVGYGGAAKAILYALLKLEYKKIRIFNRSFNKLKNLKNNRIEGHDILELKNFINSSSLIVNTVPADVFGKLNINKKLLSNTIVSDIIYQPKETTFLRYFKNPKEKVYGISMLVNQAACCFKEWFSITPAIDDGLKEIINKKIIK